MNSQLRGWTLLIILLASAHGRALRGDQPPLDSETAREAPAADRYGDPLPGGAVARLGTVRFRHVGPVKSVAFSPDGKILASADYNGPVRLWVSSTGKHILKFDRQSYGSYSLVFTPDGKVLAGVNREGTIRLWETATGKELRQFPGPKSLSFPVNAIAISPDGSSLAAGKEQAVCLWDLDTGKEIRQLRGHGSEVQSVAFSPDGKALASASSRDQTIRLWSLASGKELLKLPGSSPVTFSRDGKLLAFVSSPNRLGLWETATGKLFRPVTDQVRANCSVAFSPDSRIIAWADWKHNLIHLHDIAADKELGRLGGGRSGIYSLVFSPDGKVLASGAHDRLVRLWDPASGKEINPWPGHRWAVFSVVFCPDRKTLVTASGESLWLWNTRTWKEIRSLPGASPAAVSPDGKVLASGSGQYDDESIRLWDLATAKPLRQCSGHQNLVRSLAFSPDGLRLASASFDQTVRLWETATAKALHELRGHQGVVNAVAFSPRGKVLASASFDQTIRLWDAATGKHTQRLAGHQRSVDALDFSPDGKVLASGSSDRSIRFWDMASGKEVRPPLEGHASGIRSLAYSPDGRALAAARYDGTILVRERLSDQVIHQIQTPEFAAYALAFSADGRVLATGGADSTTLIWDLTGRLKEGRLPTVRLSDQQLEALWTDLASHNAKKAAAATWSLVQAPGQSEAFLTTRLRPAQAADAKHVRKLLAGLESNDFATRRKATEELETLADVILNTLREALASQPNLEARRRVERLLERAEEPAKSPFRLQALRAVGALEQLGTQEAKHLLQTLANGSPLARLTREARMALQRLGKHKSVEQ